MKNQKCSCNQKPYLFHEEMSHRIMGCPNLREVFLVHMKKCPTCKKMFTEHAKNCAKCRKALKGAQRQRPCIGKRLMALLKYFRKKRK